ncbi:hypothetical protein [Streptomyces cavourensis]|uniref:hypothetical protein n=1 Tax=Streptomyces cavourensis TaxID=67258 RepID=UPI0020C95A0D|nr:hypothetical protein [Streptomyces cavourensis]
MRGVLVGVVGTVVVLGVAGAVAVPQAREWYEGRHEQTASYATGKAAKAERPSVPRWLPDDAASVEYAMRTTGRPSAPPSPAGSRTTPRPSSTPCARPVASASSRPR